MHWHFMVKTTLMAHPPYSLDLASCDYWAFPALKAKLQGTKFRTVQQAQAEVQRVLRMTPKEEFEQAIYDMPVRWSKCCNAGGEYFEGTNTPFSPEDLPAESAEDSDSDESSD